MTGFLESFEDDKITLDTTIYSLIAIKKAAYKLADRVDIALNPKAATSIEVIFDFTRHDAVKPADVFADFYTELLDQDLRELIKEETAPVRNLILAHAFSRTSLVPTE